MIGAFADRKRRESVSFAAGAIYSIEYLGIWAQSSPSIPAIVARIEEATETKAARATACDWGLHRLCAEERGSASAVLEGEIQSKSLGFLKSAGMIVDVPGWWSTT